MGITVSQYLLVVYPGVIILIFVMPVFGGTNVTGQILGATNCPRMSCKSQSLANPGGHHRHPPPPQQAQFFRFHIHFHQKAPVSEVGAPKTGNPGSATANTPQLEFFQQTASLKTTSS